MLHPYRFFRLSFFRFFLFFLLAVWVSGLTACQCDDGYSVSVEIKVTIEKPNPGQVSGTIPVLVSVEPNSTIRYVEVTLTPQQRLRITNQTDRVLAQLHQAPYTFRWSTFQVPDGFYHLKAIAYDLFGNPIISRITLVQVSNEPPRLWFVNCYDGQWIRDTYPLLVAINQTNTQLAAAPTLSIDGQQGPKTNENIAPFRYLIPTQDYQDGATLNLDVEGVDLRGNISRITCTPRIDNTAPTVRFIEPSKEDTLVGRTFQVRFDAQDRFGVREVRLLVDGSGCTPTGNTPLSAINCPNPGDPWIGKTKPDYPISVTLPSSYDREQSIVLSARALDEAGNLSDPPTQLRIRIDPVPPEIYIRTPGEGQVFETEVKISARITDNNQLANVKITLQNEQSKKTWELLNKTLGTPETTEDITLQSLRTKYGTGRFFINVVATDASGNSSSKQRLFLVGCVDSTDCPAGELCHNTRCLVPARLGEVCTPDLPCEIGTDCVPGQSPVCSTQTKTYCRQRCNPGNQFVSADACDAGYFCDRTTKTCLPSERCTPLGNDCPSGMHCTVADDDASFCVPIGTLPLGSQCNQNCGGQGNCTRNAWCIILINVGRTSCAQVCDTQSPNCPSGQQCVALIWSFGGKPLRYGVCQ
ncbi:MAG: Ig-like domain-containing protein [Myxococcales bacterium]|nr:Ig-like domain-containing protein [Myxococcales bacterium]MCB9643520.1 Ig-like domain-containing protein [Myxococcales bacterium]